MKNLRRLGISATLLCVLAMTAFAGETNSPPCTPGETNSPPCSLSQATPDGSTAPPVTSSPSVANDEYPIGELATEIVQQLLTIY